jgi:4-amino-4-deoxy-L-arabinose transferase-like glycosyltransferase
MAILIVLLAKLLVFSIGYATTYLHEGPAAPITILLNEFNRWDAPHYLEIAKNWYINQGDPANFIVFFPLYPVLIRAITFDFSYINFSALLVSNLSSIAAFIYLYKLTKLDFDDTVAQKAVLFLSVFPTAYFLSAPYTEGLFLVTVIASFYYARIGKWPLAGFLCMLSALTRLTGLLMLPVLIVEYLHQKHWKPKNIDAKILWIGLAAVGFFIYLGINSQVTGSPFTFMTIQKTHWYNMLDPIEGINKALLAAGGMSFPDNITRGIAPLIFAFFSWIVFCAGFIRRFRPSYLAYMLLSWLLAVATSFWMSIPRYVITIFPMFILLGLFSRRKTVTVAVTAICLVGLCFFTVLFALYAWAF